MKIIKILTILGTTLILIGVLLDLIQRQCYELPLKDFFNHPICKDFNKRK